MCAAADCVCGARPARREVSHGRSLYVCTNSECGQFSEPAVNEAFTRRVWDTVNRLEDVCLGCEGHPRLRYSSTVSLWFLQCTGCGRSTSGTMTADGAISAWVRGNRPGNDHTLELWLARGEVLNAA